MGFPVPLKEWFDKELRDFIGDTFNSTARNRDYINSKEVVSNLQKEATFSRGVWGFLSLELWQQQFHDEGHLWRNSIQRGKSNRGINVAKCCQLKRLVREAYAKLRKLGPAAYWNNHLVAHDDWSDSKTALDSINQFHWRNAQYPGYIDLMPVDDADGLVVVDYGCGPE